MNDSFMLILVFVLGWPLHMLYLTVKHPYHHYATLMPSLGYNLFKIPHKTPDALRFFFIQILEVFWKTSWALLAR